MNSQPDSDWRNLVITAAIRAGQEIMKVYNSPDFGIEQKEDNSPLTRADREADKVINELLKPTGILMVSEEDSKNHSWEERRDWERCWIIDPLDGTKEFIKRNGEFTVNIALAEKGMPVFGVVYAPAPGVLYVGEKGNGAYKMNIAQQADINALPKEPLPLQPFPATYSIVGSRSHASPETEAYVNDQRKIHGDVDFVAAGSSLKFCLLAEGKAHSYPRFAPTMEWDTAAGQAVLEAAGGKVLCWPSKDPMRYNREELRNGWFLALAPGVEA